MHVDGSSSLQRHVVSPARLGTGAIIALNLSLTLAAYVLILYLYYQYPVAFVYFVAEDSWAEWGTFAGCLICFTVLLWAILKEPALRKPSYILLAVAALFVALEEISWGQRIFGFESPELFATGNIQAETNFHNFITMRPEIAGSLASLGVVLLCFLPLWLRRRRGNLSYWVNWFGVPALSLRIIPLFVVAGVFLIDPPGVNFGAGEIGELFASIAFASLALDIAATKVRGRGNHRLSAYSVAGLLMVLGTLTFLLVRLTPGPQGVLERLNEFAAYSLPASGHYEQAEDVFAYIERNPRFLDMETRYHRGLVLSRLGRFDQSQATLQRALADQQHALAQDPEGSADYLRTSGKILFALSRRQEATVALRRALEFDGQRLAVSANPEERVHILWSLGKTQLAGGDVESAMVTLVEARNASPNRETEERIRRWLRREMSRGDVFRGLTMDPVSRHR